MLSKSNDRSIDGMFVSCNPCARAELRQQKRARKLCSAIWLAIRFKITTGYTPVFLPRILVYIRYVWALSSFIIWLALWAGKMNQILRCDWLPERWMELSCPLGTTHRVPQEIFPRKQYNKSFIDQACSVKVAGYWPSSFFVSLWTSTPSWSIRTRPIPSHLDLTLGQ